MDLLADTSRITRLYLSGIGGGKRLTKKIVLSRAFAKLGKVPFYYTGLPCRRGHDALRYTISGHCTECMKAYNQSREKKRYVHCPVRARKTLLAQYGLTREDYEHILVHQNGVCAICKEKPPKVFDIDHCHKTGRVRGLLCGNCNRILGFAKDDPERLLAAVRYLQTPVGRRIRRS